jgi:DNA repair protein SbcC/Rad50
MNPWLKQLTVSNFRSLKGTITVPLGGSIVLIHGPNAAGKTSVLSAIEMGLTGRLATLVRAEPEYERHLLHRGASTGRIELQATSLPGIEDAGPDANLTVGPLGASGAPLLKGGLPSFFAERCYLAQQSLGRLLEIYQVAGSPTGSPLTLFVNHLLRLDQLESLIDGLYVAGDFRRVKKIPQYADAEQLLQSLTQAQEAEAARDAAHAMEAEELQRRVQAALPTFPVGVHLADTQKIQALLEEDEEEAQLRTLARNRRDLKALEERVIAASNESEASVHREAEASASSAWHALDEWSRAHGERLENALLREAKLLGEVVGAPEGRMLQYSQDLLARVAAERLRVQGVVERDDAAAAQMKVLDEQIANAEARLAIVEDEQSAVAKDVSDLARVLADVATHVEGDRCPVCEREFSEVSDVPLTARLATRLDQLSQSTRAFQLGVAQRATFRTEVAGNRRRREALSGERLSQPERAATKARAADLAELEREFRELRPLLEARERTARAVVLADRALADLRARGGAMKEVRDQLAESAKLVGERPLQDSESVASALQRLVVRLNEDEERWVERQRLRRDALAAHKQLQGLNRARNELKETMSRRKTQLEEVRSVLSVVEGRMHEARGLAEAARRVRSAVIGRVFNETLNKIWRELFVRLAPGEAFVPAFKVPDVTRGPVVAQFETVHRDGERGGAPGAMLSAGNLNTAALTLFLALHLAVEARLPCVLLDDPVQSMDEVHVAQFAALLRTFVRGHERQVVIAVHERALFEYLKLELSPAFPGERLVTVELKRKDDGDTNAEPNFYDWKRDVVTFAA